MNELAIYLGFSILFIAYVFQLIASVDESLRTRHTANLPLRQFIIGGRGRILLRHWPFFGITILFPFIFSAIPMLMTIPQFGVKVGSEDIISVGQVFVTISSFAKNYLIVLITLEFSLLYGLERLPSIWKRLLVLTTALDLIMYLLMSYIHFNMDSQIAAYHQISMWSLAFLIMGCIASFFASLYVVISVTLLNER